MPLLTLRISIAPYNWMVPPIQHCPEAEKIGGFIAGGFIVEYEGEWEDRVE